MNDENMKTQNQTTQPNPPPITTPKPRPLAIRILGWIILVLGVLGTANAVSQIVMGIVWGPTIVGLVICLLMVFGGLAMARGRKQS
jgi:hypothetical protein